LYSCGIRKSDVTLPEIQVKMSLEESPKRKGRRFKDEATITSPLEGISPEDLLPPQEPLLNVFSFGWMEDGRLGYDADDPSHIQSVPRPMATLRAAQPKKKMAGGGGGGDAKKQHDTSESKSTSTSTSTSSSNEASKEEAHHNDDGDDLDEDPDAPPKMEERFIVVAVAAGVRHTIMYMTNVYPESEEQARKIREDAEDKRRAILLGREPEKKEKDRFATDNRRKFRVMMTGSNQRGLCEEPGFAKPVDLRWEKDEEPVDIAAGNGISYIVTRTGDMFSWGNGRYGALGHGDEETTQIPRQITALKKVTLKRIACGYYHAIATSEQGLLFSWGRNNKGQLSRGFESPFECVPDKVSGFDWEKDAPLDVACGAEHTLAIMSKKSNDGTTKILVYAWGDESRGQLGSGDAHARFKPQENRWVTKFCQKNSFHPQHVTCGAYHNLMLTSTNQLVTWGAGDYGQLGHGTMWDDPAPNLISDLKGVTHVAGGARHSVAAASKIGILSWGYNGYGELGLGDDNIRTQPTALTSFSRSLIRGLVAGDRHTVVVTSHRAVKANEDPALRPFFSVIEENANKMVVKQVRIMMEKQGFDPDLLDDGETAVPNQVGSTDEPLRVDKFEKGLRYCMDSFVDPADWRRKSYEVCFEARLKNFHLKSVCLACARFCQSDLRLTPYVRVRSEGNTMCYCKASGKCVCYWSVIRSKFDLIAGEDGCIMPKQIRKLLVNLRAPAPVEVEDVDECLVELAQGVAGDSEEPRVPAVPFEKWYRIYYDEFEDDAKG
jgi:hypothetical protein